MFTRDRNGLYDDAPEHPAFALLDTLAKGSNEEIRGVFARILRDAKIPATRAASIMRCGRTRYFRDLKVEFAALGAPVEDLEPLVAPTVPYPVDKRGVVA